MDPRILLRMARLVRRPPSWRMVVLGAAVIAVALLLAGVEAIWGWPDWLTPARTRP